MGLTKISTGGVKDDTASQAKIADEAVDEARLQVSNAGSNGQFLSKQSGNTGGLTWATPPDNNTVYTHPNHSGEVTSTADGAQVIADDVVDEANLKVSNSPTNGQFLSAQSGNTGGLTWADAGGGIATEYDCWDMGGTSGAGTYVRWNYTVLGLGAAADGYTNWYRLSGLTPVGNGMTESAGVWTFPSTGMWKIQLHLNTVLASNGAYTQQLRPEFSSNSGTSWTNKTIFEWYQTLNSQSYSLETMLYFQNITNTTNDRLRFSVWNSNPYTQSFRGVSKIEFTKVA